MDNALHSDVWVDFQRSLGHLVFQGQGDGWHYLAVRRSGQRWPYLYCPSDCPSGPEAVTPQAFDAALADLERTAREQGCCFVRIAPITTSISEPFETLESALYRRGLRPSPRQIRPYKSTQIIDLTRDVDEIMRDIAPKNRNVYRNIHKKGVTCTASSDPADIDLLLPFLDAVAERNGFHRKSDEYLRAAARHLMPLGAATLYIARLGQQPIGAVLVYDWGSTRSYAHAAMDYEHRKLNAGVALMVRMILDAKAKGLTRFDFWGIAPEGAGPEHEDYGFTKFKKSFGGHPETYPGTWDLPVNPIKYLVLRTDQMVREKASGVASKLRRLIRVRQRSN